MALRLKGNRRYPTTPVVTDDPQNHTQVLMAMKESLEIGQRRTSDILNSFIRVEDLVDLGIITIQGGVNAIFEADLSQIADIGDLTGSAEGDFLRFRSGVWVNDQLANADITQTMVTQHEAALSIDWSQLTSIPSPITAYAGGDVPSAFTLGIVDSVDAAAWRTAIGAGTSTVTPAALTKADDTNVTLALGGTPATALLQAVSLTLGWAGTLAAIRGGTGFGAYTVGDLLYADTTTTLAKLAATTNGFVLTLAAGVPTWAAASGGSGTPANPTASVGLTAVNGVLTTYMRSDAAPALSQAIAPTWTDLHTFSNVSTSSLDGTILLSSTIPIIGFREGGATTDQKVWDIVAFQSSIRVRTADDSGGANKDALRFDRTGTALTTMVYGNGTDLPGHTFHGQVNFPYHVEFTRLATTSYDGQATFRGAYILNGYFETDQATDKGGWDMAINAGVFAIRSSNDAGTTQRNAWSATRGTGVALASLVYGNSTDMPSHTFHGATTVSAVSSGTSLTVNQSISTGGFVLEGTGNIIAVGLVRNTNGGSAAGALWDVTNGTDTLAFLMTGTGYAGSPLTGGPTGTFGAIYNNTAKALAFGVNLTASGYIATTGEWNFLTQGIFQSILRITNTAPQIIYNETDGGSNAKRWIQYANLEVMHFATLNDAESVIKDYLTITRTAGAPATMSYGNVTDLPSHTFYGTVMGTASGYGATSAAFQASAVAPCFLLDETDGGTDKRYTRLLSIGGVIRFDAMNNASSQAAEIFTIDRGASGGNATVTAIRYGNVTDLATHGFNSAPIGAERIIFYGNQNGAMFARWRNTANNYSYHQYERNSVANGYIGDGDAMTSGGAGTDWGIAAANNLILASGNGVPNAYLMVKAAGGIFAPLLHNNGAAGNIESATYSPTLTSIVGTVTSLTNEAWQYSRVGNVVTVSGSFTGDITGATAVVDVAVSLPIASALATQGQVAGTCGTSRSDETQTNNAGRVIADTTNDRALCRTGVSITGTNTWRFTVHFTYLIV